MGERLRAEMIHNGRDRIDPGRADLEIERWVEADLRRVAEQREASLRAVANAQASESRCLEALLPVSARVAERFRQMEQSTRQIRSSRCHEVVVRLRQPSSSCVSVSMRWGAKFCLTDAERQLMRSYQRRPRRLFRYPEMVVGHEYHELGAVLDGTTQTLRLGSGATCSIADLLARPTIVDGYLATGLASPPLIRSEYRRSEGYRERAR